jgi:hypothetical protein
MGYGMTDPRPLSALRNALESGSPDRMARALLRHYTPAQLVKLGLPLEAVTQRNGEPVWTEEARAVVVRVVRRLIGRLEG